MFLGCPRRITENLCKQLNQLLSKIMTVGYISLLNVSRMSNTNYMANSQRAWFVMTDNVLLMMLLVSYTAIFLINTFPLTG